MDANAADLSEALGGMAPEEVCNSSLLKKFEIFECPDVLAYGGPDTDAGRNWVLRRGWRTNLRSATFGLINPGRPGEGHISLTAIFTRSANPYVGLILSSVW